MKKRITLESGGMMVEVEDVNMTDEALAKAAVDLHDALAHEVSERMRVAQLASRLVPAGGPMGPVLS